jgi:GT2 family glycosyltransferase/2-polyprenyl-3-methyl-5-hydroxy-6-metoxy-1,4-benzoquinol methylase
MLQFTGERFIPTKELVNDEIGIEHLHRYNSIIPFVEHKTVLDIACGEGYGAALLAKHAKKVTGIDIDEQCIHWATANYATASDTLHFITGSVNQIPLADSSIDVVVSFETIEHVDAATQAAFMAEVKRVLKPDGILIISTPNTENYSSHGHNNQFHIKEFDKHEFWNFLQDHFAHVYHFEQGYEIVSTITGLELGKITNLKVLNWDRELKQPDRKYLISIAGNQSIPDSDAICSAVLQVDKDFKGLINYIISLQQNEKQLQQQSDTLTLALTKYKRVLESYTKTIQELQERNSELATTVEQVSELLNDKENIIADLNHRITTLHQQADQLNGILSEIYNSEGWKLLSIYYRFKAKLLPPGSDRYKKVKRFVNKLRNKKNDDFPIPAISSKIKEESAFVEITHFDTIEFPVYDKPKVSIVIPAYNGWQMNYQCLHSIKQNTYGVSYEVIFADDNSADETKNIKDYIKNIVVARNETNLGFLKNCNNAASLAKGQYIVFLNNDTKVTKGWLSSLAELMEKDKSIGMTGSKLVYPDGRLQEAGGIIWQDASGWNFGHKQNPDAPEFNYVKEVDYISGASIMIRKELWDKIGGFDELYVPAYCEDSDLAFKIREMNLKVVYQPASVVIHYEGFSHGTEQNKKSGLTNTKQYQELNKVKFAERWKAQLQKQFPNAVDVFHARDRSAGKKTILVIDHYVPQFDKDAGSRTTFQYLEAFTELGLNVKFLGDDFYKYEPYTSILQQKGIEVLYGNHYAKNIEEWLHNNAKYFDYVLLNRPHISSKYIDLLRKETKATIFYYGHDLHFVRELKEYEITRNEKKLASSREWKSIEYDLFKKSDVILTPTLKEKETIGVDFSDKKIEVMPAFFYDKIAMPIMDFEERRNLLFVGGFKHVPNVDAVVWFIEEILPEICKHIPDIQFILAGSHVPEKIANYASPNVVVKGFVSDIELNRLYSTCKMAVIPLRFGAGLKGKTVEAMVKGLPIVSTSIGLEGLNDLENALNAYDSAEEFANAIVNLYNDKSALENVSTWMVNYSNKHFTKEVAKDFFRSLFGL